MNTPNDCFRITSEKIKKKTRLDRFISEQLHTLSRQRIQALIRGGHVSDLNGMVITDPATKVLSHHEYTVLIPPPEPTDIVANPSIAIDIIYEDDDLAVVNKAAGVTVHPGAGNYNDTLVNGLIHHFKDSLSSVGGVERPGIVHRLDKDTSGLMMIAKNDIAHQGLTEQLSTRALSRKYLCVCWNVMKPKNGIIHTHIGRHSKNRKLMAVVPETTGKEAITHYQTQSVHYDERISLVECHLKTGRTHQIRVHLSHEGCPLIGDASYGRNPIQKHRKHLPDLALDYIQTIDRQMLHAYHIGFIHPNHKKEMSFTVNPPEDMQKLINILQN
ncbi:MAG: RluA family pseudouridine synthase [Rickettsiales bacterium]|nr:RluA family pseudouridine synthase [Rickettsiales bacterium]